MQTVNTKSPCYWVPHLIDDLALVASDFPQHGFDVLLYRIGGAVHSISDLAALLSCEEGLKNAGSRLRQCWRGGCTGLEV